MEKAMAHGLSGTTMVTVHTDAPPSEAEWDAYLHDITLALQRGRVSGIVVFTRGGGPTSTQRIRYARVLERLNVVVPCAVVTDSAVARGIVTAIAWLTGKHIAAFPSAEIRYALGFAGVAVYGDVARKLGTLGSTIGVDIPSLGSLAA